MAGKAEQASNWARATAPSCVGNSDDCTLMATTTRDTTAGYLLPTEFCESCAQAWDRFIDNYDGPGDDDAWAGGFAENH